MSKAGKWQLTQQVQSGGWRQVGGATGAFLTSRCILPCLLVPADGAGACGSTAQCTSPTQRPQRPGCELQARNTLQQLDVGHPQCAPPPQARGPTLSSVLCRPSLRPSLGLPISPEDPHFLEAQEQSNITSSVVRSVLDSTTSTPLLALSSRYQLLPPRYPALAASPLLAGILILPGRLFLGHNSSLQLALLPAQPITPKPALVQPTAD